MSTGQPYDEERVVRQSDHQDQPTEVVRRSEYAQETDGVREDIAVDHVVARRAMLGRIGSILWFFCAIIEIVLGLRVVFRLLEANRDNGFVHFIYRFSGPFVRPFEGIFSNPTSNGAVLDTGALVAMVIYAIITWLIVRLLWLLLDTPESGARRSVSRYHHDRI